MLTAAGLSTGLSEPQSSDACLGWDDPPLLSVIDRFPSACVVVTKQELKKRAGRSSNDSSNTPSRGTAFPPTYLPR